MMSTSSNLSKEKLCGNNEKPKAWWGARHTFAILGFLGFVNSYSLRINLSVAIVAMVNVTSNGNSSKVGEQCEVDDSYGVDEYDTHNGEFDWDARLQGLILGSFYYGYCLTQILGGVAAERFGGKWVFGGGILGSALLTLTFPIAAETNVILFIVLRALQGVLEGMAFPAFYVLAGNWFPEEEKSFLLSMSMSGTTMGVILSLPLCGVLAEHLGWEYVFYVTGGLAVIWGIAWILLVSECPAKHSKISKAELNYIEMNTSKSLTSTKSPPFKKFFKSIPFWALVVAQVGNYMGYYTMMTGIPLYLSSILHTSIQESGIISALPYICLFVSILLVSWTSKKLESGGYVSTLNIRRIYNTIGTVGPACALVWVSFSGCDVVMTVIALCLAMGLNAGVMAGYVINFPDISPNYSGSLFGIASTISGMTGFLSPLLMGAITEGNQTIEAWRIVFMIGSGSFFFSNLVFVIFGSTEIQSWNDFEEESNEEENIESSVVQTKKN